VIWFFILCQGFRITGLDGSVEKSWRKVLEKQIPMIIGIMPNVIIFHEPGHFRYLHRTFFQSSQSSQSSQSGLDEVYRLDQPELSFELGV
jgi:hypothetical protein